MTFAVAALKAPELTQADDLSDVVRLAQTGNVDALKRLYTVYSQRVYRLFLAFAANETEAEAMTSQVFLQLFRKIKTYRGEFSLSILLQRLTLDIWLKQRRRTGLGAEEGRL